MDNEKELEVFQIVKKHLELYPEMQPQDVIKLLYQRNFGPEHSIDNPQVALAQLQKEASEVVISESEPLHVSIGNAFVRLNLNRAFHDYSLEQINDMFVRSAGVIHGSMSQFLADIKLVGRNLDGLKTDFNMDNYTEFVSWYRSQAYPAVHHSPIYRQKYQPHYRVVFNNIWNTVE